MPPRPKPSKKTNQIYAPYCIASGDIASAIINMPAVILVKAYNIYNQPILVGGGTFKDRMVGPAKASTSWTDLGNGTYAYTYTCPAVGQYKLRIKHKGHQIQGSPFTITVPVIPIPTDKSTASGSLVTQGTVNTSFTIDVQAKDANGNNITTGGAAVVAQIVTGPPGFSPFSITLTDNGNGTYSGATSGITSTGVYMTAVTVNAVAIIGSPFTFISYLASPLSTLTVPSTGTVNSTVTATIQGINLSGANVTSGEGSDLFAVAVVGPGSLAIPSTVVDNNNGTYSVQFVPVTAGAYSVAAAIHGAAIVGSPGTVTATSTGTSTLTPALCTADGSGIASANQNYFAYFVVTTVDQNSNVFYSPSAVVAATATTASGSWAVSFVDNTNGTYSGKYLPTTTETVTLAVTVNGTPIANSPFTPINVLSSCYAPYCTLNALPNAAAGEPLNWPFYMYDQNLNPVLNFHDNFVLTVNNGYPLAGVVFAPVYPGVGSLTLVGPFAGTCNATVFVVNDVNSDIMGGTPFITDFA